MYLFDTNAIIYFVRKEPEASALLSPIFAANVPLFVATISVAEFFSPRVLLDDERYGVEGILNVLSPVPLDMPMARRSGHLRSTCNLKLADSIIAASALFVNATVVTRNITDFKRVPGLSIKKI